MSKELQTAVFEAYNTILVQKTNGVVYNDADTEALGKALARGVCFEEMNKEDVITEAVDLVNCTYQINLRSQIKTMDILRSILKGFFSVQELQRKFEAGDCATAQFGNPTDSMGYRENVDVIVMSCKDGYFLIHDTVNEIVGIATNSERKVEIKGQLYCTLARSYGEGSIGRRLHGSTTAREAAASIGFIL